MTFCYVLQVNSLDFKYASSTVNVFEPCTAFLREAIVKSEALFYAWVWGYLWAITVSIVGTFPVASVSTGSSN